MNTSRSAYLINWINKLETTKVCSILLFEFHWMSYCVQYFNLSWKTLVANASVTEGIVSEDVLAFFKIAKETARTRQGESWFASCQLILKQAKFWHSFIFQSSCLGQIYSQWHFRHITVVIKHMIKECWNIQKGFGFCLFSFFCLFFFILYYIFPFFIIIM